MFLRCASEVIELLKHKHCSRDEASGKNNRPQIVEDKLEFILVPTLSWSIASRINRSLHSMDHSGNSDMAIRVLLVEDEDEIAEFIAQGLREEGFTVDRASNGHEGESAIDSSKWDLIVLDWWLPGPDGMALLRALRSNDNATPVLFLTARDAIRERVDALRAGADDYLCKPFAFEELLARAEALIRRATRGSTEWRYDDVVLDMSTNSAKRAGTLLSLTAREQALLLFFLRHPGQDLSRSELYEHVWHDEFDGLSNTLEVHVMELRRKLEALGPRLIHTVRGRGYRLGDRKGSETL